MSSAELPKVRNKLLRILRNEIDRRLDTSLHKSVKIDLGMEDQQQQVGKHKIKLVSEDSSAISKPGMPSFVDRVLMLLNRQPAESIPLSATQKIVEVFERPDIQGKLLILGEPGSGKTTELLHLAKDLVEGASQDKNLPIPLILELSTWKESESMQQWIADTVKKQYGLAPKITDQWLQQDDIFLLLDGLDELGLMNQKKCIGAINAFMTKKVRYGLVVCCRREEYEAGQIKLDSLNGAVYLEPLREEQIQTFFKQLNRSSIWQQIRTNSKLVELARSPLFLSMMVVAYQGRGIASQADLFDAFIAQKLREGSNNVYPPNK
ncbi:MAG: NACHT domain-containing protein [Leptolyngbyaceae cyanobacterium]